MLPKFRTMTYSVFRACERFGILPPGAEAKWDECSNWSQLQLLSYTMIRDMEGSAG